MNEDNSAVSDNFKRYNVLWGRNSYLCYCKANVGGDRKPKNNFGLVIKIGDWQSHPPCPSSQRSTDAEKRKLIWMMLLQGLSQYCTWNLFFGSLKLQWQFYVGKMSSFRTGSGKTLCFSLPLILNDTDMVLTVSPLTALMIDQVHIIYQ